MEPTRDEQAVVDLLDVILRDGAILQADVIVTVADVPLVGINLQAAVAGMSTMRDYGFFEEWDAVTREMASDQRAATRRGKFVPREESGHVGDDQHIPPGKRPERPARSSDDRSPPSKRPRHGDRPDRSGRPEGSPREWSAAPERPKGSERPSSARGGEFPVRSNAADAESVPGPSEDEREESGDDREADDGYGDDRDADADTDDSDADADTDDPSDPDG